MLLLSAILSPATVLAATDDTTEETFYGYQNATYNKTNVKTDSNKETYAPWYRDVYKYNYDYKQTFRCRISPCMIPKPIQGPYGRSI